MPRYKLYGNYPNNPTLGIDIIAYKLDNLQSTNDKVLYIEVKCRLSAKNFNALQEAINDISKRDKEYALSLDLARRKLELLGNFDEAREVARFSNPEKPYNLIKGAGLITIADVCTSNDFLGVNITIGDKIETYVIHASDIWSLAQDLWRRASSLYFCKNQFISR